MSVFTNFLKNPIRSWGSAQDQRHRHQHVVQGRSVGQRGLRVVHENAQVRRSSPQRIPRPGRGARFHPRVPRKGLQPEAAAFGARLSAARRVRTQSQGGRYAAAFCMSFPRHREIFPSDEDAGFAANVPAHRQDEFPAGYSLAVALQHGPLPLHAGHSML